MLASCAVILVITSGGSIASQRGEDTVVPVLTDLIKSMHEHPFRSTYMVELAHELREDAARLRLADREKSDELMERAISVLEFVEKKHPGAMTDRAYFDLGMAYTALGQRESVTTVLEKLVEKFPESPHRRDACLALASLHASGDRAKSEKYRRMADP